ncbi:hypothetical protein NE237_028481 [Protea cynaroides]|uniref:Uncharacterized protein n=1 Tax=Protea cynaroides TaxID=273540 RepID=A0A9Q0JSW9_9MAGN|nr:hypothetical protein NE237_028481 [Protea cynaroides]
MLTRFEEAAIEAPEVEKMLGALLSRGRQVCIAVVEKAELRNGNGVIEPSDSMESKSWGVAVNKNNNIIMECKINNRTFSSHCLISRWPMSWSPGSNGACSLKVIIAFVE